MALPSGLQYQVLKQGTDRATPKADSVVTVHYEGKLIDGKLFDSSIKAGKPLTMKANELIPGWTEALTRMKVGDKWKLFIPPNLAYGERTPTPLIPPNSALVFEVELLDRSKGMLAYLVGAVGRGVLYGPTANGAPPIDFSEQSTCLLW